MCPLSTCLTTVHTSFLPALYLLSLFIRIGIAKVTTSGNRSASLCGDLAAAPCRPCCGRPTPLGLSPHRGVRGRGAACDRARLLCLALRALRMSGVPSTRAEAMACVARCAHLRSAWETSASGRALSGRRRCCALVARGAASRGAAVAASRRCPSCEEVEEGRQGARIDAGSHRCSAR